MGLYFALLPVFGRVCYATGITGQEYIDDNSGIFKSLEQNILTVLRNIIIFSSVLLAVALVYAIVSQFMLPGGDTKKGWDIIKRSFIAWLCLNGLGAIITYAFSFLPKNAGL